MSASVTREEYQAAYQAANREKISARRAAYHIANREKNNARSATWRAANRESIRALDKANYAADPEQKRARSAARYASDPEKHRAALAAQRAANPKNHRACSIAWARANREKANAAKAAYKASKIRAMPSWLTSEQRLAIVDWYRRATARGLTVDHIVPLRGRNVSGLHVPWNMQLLSKTQNSIKHNHLKYDV